MRARPPSSRACAPGGTRSADERPGRLPSASGRPCLPAPGLPAVRPRRFRSLRGRGRRPGLLRSVCRRRSRCPARHVETRRARALSRRALLASNQLHAEDATALTNLLGRVAAAIDDPAGLSLAAGLDCIIRRLFPPRDLAVSLALARRSVDLAEESGDPDAIARASMRAGRSLYSLGRIDEAFVQVRRAFSLRDELEDDSAISIAAGQLAQISGDRGDQHGAKFYSEVARATARDDMSRWGAELNLGAYYAGADCRLAIGHLERSIEYSRKAGVEGVTGAAWPLAHCYLAVGKDKAALRLTTESLSNLGPSPDPAGAVPLLVERSHNFLKTGQLAAAEADLLEALRMTRSSGRDTDQISPLIELSPFRLRQRRYSEARAMARTSAGLAAGVSPGPPLPAARAGAQPGQRATPDRTLPTAR